MAEDSKIEWTTHTFNPWRGCTKVSAGCANCYAETLSKRWEGRHGIWGPNGTRVVSGEATWREPIKWHKKATEAGERHRVFCASLADVFEGRATMPPGSAHAIEAARLRLFRLIHATPQLDWLLLTKRPHLIREGIASALRLVDAYAEDPAADMLTDWLAGKAPANVWLGTSVENQCTADERIPHLVNTPAVVRFLSCEPLLGPVNLDVGRAIGGDPDFVSEDDDALGSVLGGVNGIDWVIVGGESGAGARDCKIQWVRGLVDQCKESGTPVFVKQLGARPTIGDGTKDGWHLEVIRLKSGKGGDPAEWPADLRVRQFPKVAA